jgi:hypothetical protein
MAKCKVCGKEFTPCRTNTPLNWRRVACCAEHGAIWFEKIEAARIAQPNVEPEHNEELQALLSVEEPIEPVEAEPVEEIVEIAEPEQADTVLQALEGSEAIEEQEPTQEDEESPEHYKGRKHR